MGSRVHWPSENREGDLERRDRHHRAWARNGLRAGLPRRLDLGVGVAGTSRSGVSGRSWPRRQGLFSGRDSAGLLKALDRPRLVFWPLPAGPLIDRIIGESRPRLRPGRRDPRRRQFLLGRWHPAARKEWRSTASTSSDLGVERPGRRGPSMRPCFNDRRISGSGRDGRAPPAEARRAEKGGYVHAGGPGAGHSSKLVHKRIEFGMLQRSAMSLSASRSASRSARLAGKLPGLAPGVGDQVPGSLTSGRGLWR